MHFRQFDSIIIFWYDLFEIIISFLILFWHLNPKQRVDSNYLRIEWKIATQEKQYDLVTQISQASQTSQILIQRRHIPFVFHELIIVVKMEFDVPCIFVTSFIYGCCRLCNACERVLLFVPVIISIPYVISDVLIQLK